MRDAYNHRLRLVESARQRGIKPTARLFHTTGPTVRKWLRRYQQLGPSGLRERSRAPHHQPRQTAPEIERQVVELRKTLPTFGARRLVREFDLPLSHRALERIWRAHGLMPKRRRKYQRKQDLAAIKATWRLFQQISADTKDLDDIPHFWPQAQARGLPVVQYTARDVRSRQHLARYGVSLRDLVCQTDNGGEFIGRHNPSGPRTGFPAALGSSQHVRIPPAAHTYQSDVETVHRLVEDEFFDLETFTSRGEFLAKAHTYQLYFNLVRPNSHKENQSPWQIIERLAPRSPLELCLLPPVFLDYYINDSGGYDVPRLPYAAVRAVAQRRNAPFPGRRLEKPGSRVHLIPRSAFHVPAELEPHCREHLLGKSMHLTRPEAGVERRRKHFGGDGLFDRGHQGPATFPRVLHNPGVVGKRRVFGQRHCAQVEQPRADHAPTSPYLRDIRDIECVTQVLRQILRIRVGQDVEALCVGLHQAIFDAVVNHLDEMPGTGRTAMEVTFVRSALLLLAPGRAGNLAASWCKGPEDGLEMSESLFFSPDHQAVASLRSPDAAARTHVQVLDASPFQGVSAAHIIFIVGVAAVDNDVTRLQPLG